MTNITQCLQELAQTFELQGFPMDKSGSVSFSIGQDTLMIDYTDSTGSVDSLVCVSVLRACPPFDTTIGEKALRLCDMCTFPYPVRAGLLPDKNIVFTLPLAQSECTAQMVLKIYEHLKSLHNAL